MFLRDKNQICKKNQLHGLQPAHSLLKLANIFIKLHEMLFFI